MKIIVRKGVNSCANMYRYMFVMKKWTIISLTLCLLLMVVAIRTKECRNDSFWSIGVEWNLYLLSFSFRISICVRNNVEKLMRDFERTELRRVVDLTLSGEWLCRILWRLCWLNDRVDMIHKGLCRNLWMLCWLNDRVDMIHAGYAETYEGFVG